MERENISKITAALYRVTERMDDREALKWKLRERALELNEIAHKKQEERTMRDEENQEKFLESIIGMLELTASTIFVAKINFDVLLREYRAIQATKKTETMNPFPILVRYDVPIERRDIERPSPIPVVASEHNENSTTEERGERQKKILSRLGNGAHTSIGEFTQTFGSQVSEKTIQRDLNDLMIQGLVKAEGDKRWRKYSIIAS